MSFYTGLKRNVQIFRIPSTPICESWRCSRPVSHAWGALSKPRAMSYPEPLQDTARSNAASNQTHYKPMQARHFLAPHNQEAVSCA